MPRNRLKLAPNESSMQKRATRPKKRKRASKVKSVSNLIKEADAVFSQYIRRKYADRDGMVKSFTGNEVKHWKQMHCGHYLSRMYKAMRWDEDNARPQSMAENIWKHGNPIEFRINLVAEIGEDRVKALEAKRHGVFRSTREHIQGIIDHYKALLETL